MDNEDIFRMAIDAGAKDCANPDKWGILEISYENLEHFAALVAAHEREKVVQWMMERGYATGHGDTIQELIKEVEWQVAELENEACAKVCESYQDAVDRHKWPNGYECAAAIRARGEQ